MMKTIIWVTILCGIALAAPQVREKRSDEKSGEKPLEKPGQSPLNKLKCHYFPLSVLLFKRTLKHLVKKVDYGVESSLQQIQEFNEEAAKQITANDKDKLAALAAKWQNLGISSARKVDRVAGDLALMALAISAGYSVDFDEYNRCGNFTAGLSDLGELVKNPADLLKKVVRVVGMDSVCFSVILNQILSHQDLQMYDKTKPIGEKKAMEMTFALLQELHILKLNGGRLLRALERVYHLLAGGQGGQGQGGQGQGGQGQGGQGQGGQGQGGQGQGGQGQGGQSQGGQGRGGQGQGGQGQGGQGQGGQGQGGQGQGGQGQGGNGQGGNGQGGPGGAGQGQTTSDKRILDLLRRYLELKRGHSGEGERGCSHKDSYEEEEEENQVVVAPYSRKEYFEAIQKVIAKVLQIQNRLQTSVQELKKPDLTPEEAGAVLSKFYQQMQLSGGDIDQSLKTLVDVVVRLYINSNSSEFLPMNECGALPQISDLKEGATAADIIEKLKEVTEDNAECFRKLINFEHELETELDKHCNGMTEATANRLMEKFFLDLHLLRQAGGRFFMAVGGGLHALATKPGQKQGRELQMMEKELRGLLEKRLALS